MDDAAKKVLTRLQTLCARQECCSRDIFEKALKRLDGDGSAAAEVLAALVSEKYVDDARYAAAFAREKSAITGWGPVKIRFALRAKGVGEDAIRSALAEIEKAPADERLAKLLAAKARTLEGDPQAKLKLIRFALSRGYEYDAVRSLVDELL